MKSMRILIVRLLLFFYLTSSYLSATHIDKNVTQQHSDCKVCIIVKNLHAPDIPHSDVSCIHYDNFYEKILFHQQIVTTIALKGFNSHAPPIFS